MTSRRTSLGLGLGLVAGLTGNAGRAFAQGHWPVRPVRIVVPYPAGGVTDAVARMLAERLSPLLGQPVVVDNRACARGPRA